MATLQVKVVPGASRSRIAGRYGDAIKVQVAAAPERGKANDAVIELIAQSLGLRRADVQITAGHTQPRKTLTIASLEQPALDARLARILEP